MKILKESNSDPWWVGREVNCSCGAKVVVEKDDRGETDGYRIDHFMSNEFAFTCKCGLTTWVDQIEAD